MAVEAMQHGAFDFVPKPFRDQELLDRVHRALAKDRETRAQLGQTDSIRRRFASLTPREQEVLELLVRGSSNKVMAADLGLSQRTVEIHRAHVMDKMEARSVAQLVRMVLDAGLLKQASVS
jgi:FixJ family two-component response regulator